jgi:hypothetical protein
MDAPEILEEILAHHGVKGMKWGVSRAKTARAAARSSEVTVRDKRKKLKTSGGVGRPAHPDAVRARTTGQIAKKSGLKALSNKELQDYNTRLNLEMNASRLRHQDSSTARRFIRSMVGKKAPGAIDTGMKAAMNTRPVRKRMARGAAALAIAGM